MMRFLLTAGALLLLVALAGAYALLRPNQPQLAPALEIESWDVVADGEHNSNTDMIFWRGHFWLIHAASPYHMGTTKSHLVIRRSSDARAWETVASLRVPGKDIRDPKFAPIGGRLFLYALTNEGFFATPEGTVVSISQDGTAWSEFRPVGPEGWLFWRPKSPDGRTWYVPAYWWDHGKSVLLRSLDGLEWERVSTIYEGEGNDETAIEFLPNGRLLATARLEVTPDNVLGNQDASTLLAVAAPPFQRWTYQKSRVTRLDGPVLFSHAGRVFAVARHQPGGRGPLMRLGGALSRKRTALYQVTPQSLSYLSDLPSAGDTTYAGVVLRDGFAYVDYYTSAIERDYPWLLGMFLPTDIRMARIPLEALLALADQKQASGVAEPRSAGPSRGRGEASPRGPRPNPRVRGRLDGERPRGGRRNPAAR